MIALAFLALAGLQSPALPASVPAGTRAFFERGPGYVPPGGLPAGSAPGALFATSGLSLRAVAVPHFPGVYNCLLSGTGSGYDEMFLFAAPPGYPGLPAATPPGASAARPALVVFHAYGVSHADALFHTSFLDEARRRGWYFIAPLGAFQNHFGCSESRINTRAVLELLGSQCPIDRQRVYGVGFSMGGGAAASQAAHDTDPDGIRFAALVDHTGSVSLTHVHANESPAIRTALETRLGGSPLQRAFEYRRCSTIDLDPLGWDPSQASDMSINLAGTPLLVWCASRDPNRYLLEETRAFYWDQRGRGNDPDLRTVVSHLHSWSTLDESQVCEWLRSQPALVAHVLDGAALADEDGDWFGFSIEQEKAGQFTPFDWLAVPASNRLNLTATANLARVRLDARDFGLSYAPGSLLVLNHGTADGQGETIVLEGIPAGANPSVTLGGAPCSVPFDPLAGELTLPALDGAPHQWKVQF